MIYIKSREEIKLMKESGRILALIIKSLCDSVKPGMKTKEIDKLANELVLINKVQPAFLGYNGFPASVCTSINDEIVHGVPSDKALVQGDMLSIDMGVIYQGWYSDSAITMPVLGEMTFDAWKNQYPDRAKLISVTQQALYEGIKVAKIGNTINDISKTIEQTVKPHNYGIVRDLVGHGIGKDLHEEPHVPNFVSSDKSPEIKEGMVIAIEPMITTGTWKVEVAKDKFTYKTKDGSMSAHFEHTVAITKNGPEILT